jgi:hypothetical protein
VITIAVRLKGSVPNDRFVMPMIRVEMARRTEQKRRFARGLTKILVRFAGWIQSVLDLRVVVGGQQAFSQ